MSRSNQAVAQEIQDTIDEDKADEVVHKYKKIEEKCDTVLAKIKKRKRTKRA
jgi:hypothetical protein